jgi:23S rRNA-/tRNA-specific pseudouridylate synthase
LSLRRAPITLSELKILGEYRGLLFVDKPAGLQTESDLRSTDSLVSRIATQLAEPVSRVHALSRLDTGVSGVVTLGLSPDARRLVQGWREQGRFKRRYLALASGQPRQQSGAWNESIGRAAGSLRVIFGRHAEAAQTDFAVIESTAEAPRATPSVVHLLALAPLTGRTHQLRVHCAAHAVPLLGDRAYGGTSRLISESGAVKSLDRIALHAAWVELPLPQALRIEAPIPPFLLEIWRDRAGQEAAFDAARRASLGA